MIRQILLIASLFFSMHISAQTGIGTTTPDASAKLDVSATNKGFLPPRVTLTSGTDNTTIPNPATGLLLYNTGNNAGLAAGYYYWNGTSWATIATASGSGVSASILRGSRSAAQTGLTNGGTVVFNQVDNTAGQDMSLNTSTGQITLAAGRTYRLMAQVPNYQTSSGDTRLQLAWYNETTGAYIGSSISSYPPQSGASYGTTGGLSEAIITTTTSTVVSYRIAQLSNATQLGGSSDFLSAGSFPWFEAQVISGNAPVTGQTVDYISVVRNILQTVNTGDNIIFNTINGGNILYSTTTGNFTLTAGKTYRLTGAVSLDGTNSSASEIDVSWKNAAGEIIGNKGLILSSTFVSNAAGNGITDVIYTPIVSTTVSLNVTYASANAKTVPNYTYANIQQIGSSAIVNPWTLAGLNTYNLLGKVGIGNNAPNATLDIRSNPTSISDPGTGYIGIGTTSTTAATAGAGAVRYNTTNGLIEFSNGTKWQSLAPGNTPMYAQFSSNAAQTFNAVGGKINFQTTNINTGNITISGNNTISLPANRIYRIDFNMGWANMAGTWARFAVYNASTGVQISPTAHLENSTGTISGSGIASAFINTNTGALILDVRYVAPGNTNTVLGDTSNGGNYPTITIQTVD